jgi:hypothetical protein
VTRRSRRRLASAPPGRRSSYDYEWEFTRRITLQCPSEAGHVIGHARQDVAGTALDGNVSFRGPPEDRERSIHWVCERCDRAAIKNGDLNGRGRVRRHEGMVLAAPLLKLFTLLAKHGPSAIRVRMRAQDIAEMSMRVASGEQLANAMAAEAARARRHRGARGDPT